MTPQESQGLTLTGYTGDPMPVPGHDPRGGSEAHHLRHAKFPPALRDQELSERDWTPPDWNRPDGPIPAPYRTLGRSDQGPTDLCEWILRFPTAPIVGINRLIEHQVTIEQPQPKFHSFRILGRTNFEPPATDIYLLNHGLNEVDDLGFFYDFASHLLRESNTRRHLCIVRPFPGHLTRQVLSGPYTQTPLDRYLNDAGELFRQFLRFMVETRWFLSALAPITHYNTAIGADLLCPSGRGAGADRGSHETLAATMISEWKGCQFASRLAHELHKDRTTPIKSGTLDASSVRASISALRSFVVPPGAILSTDREEVGKAIERATPRFHVVGYSLGGFAAQSIFFSWPFLIGGCTTLLSGGALRSLTPTAFAHPEEWQTVLHALRYELDASLLDGRIRKTGVVIDPGGEYRLSTADDASAANVRTLVAGLDHRIFNFFQRVFYEVFQQEYPSAYKTRAGEFSRRLLFVLGGSDEIVRTQSVIDAAPEHEGVNLLQIANLSHFLGRDATGVEKGQREYWLPEIARMARRFGEAADKIRRRDLTRAWLADGVNPWNDLLDDVHVDPAPEPDVSLPSPQFEKCLDDMVALQGRRALESPRGAGMLFIAQNTIPAFLLSRAGMRERASALHHSDEAVVSYLSGLQRRADQLRERPVRSRLCVLLPTRAPRWHRERGWQHPTKSETLPGLLGSDVDRSEEWSTIRDRWGDVLRYFEPPHPGGSGDRRVDAFERFSAQILREAVYFSSGAAAADAGYPAQYVTDLPNVWLLIDAMPTSSSAGALTSEGLVAGLVHTLSVWRRDAEKQATAKRSAVEILRDDLADRSTRGDLQCLRISPAHFNPRHRGRTLTRGSQLHTALSHLVLALALSISGPPSANAER